MTFLNPEEDPFGAGYHIIQSKIAVGSGGVFGKGWLNGTQSHLDFLPERHTDFIFAVFGEEFGFLGALALLSLYGFIIVRGLYLASTSQDSYGRLLAGSMIITFLIYFVRKYRNGNWVAACGWCTIAPHQLWWYIAGNDYDWIWHNYVSELA